eukprot:snap_masked-scaffold185_size275389-processed-gene-0.11 protein:Tk02508 transcript:snap_masked-scaffold185_size275389-processed-gene-0.11-mRNA-1 annotation:"sodium-driven chloride bicarbonate exchanger"
MSSLPLSFSTISISNTSLTPMNSTMSSSITKVKRFLFLWYTFSTKDGWIWPGNLASTRRSNPVTVFTFKFNVALGPAVEALGMLLTRDRVAMAASCLDLALRSPWLKSSSSCKNTFVFSFCEEGPGCTYSSNAFLMSVVLFSGTFMISFTLKNFRNTGYLPGKVRSFLADFAVIIAIFSMTGLSVLSGVEGTPKLLVPSSFKPTWEGRDWIVTHALIFPEHVGANPLWVDFVLAPVFAILATILIFMDQQITAVIVNRKEHKLLKGSGYHLDLTVLGFIIIICSVFGLPWFVAATVLSINHLQSLTKESECSAPGEKPQFLGIREQRVTAVLIGLCIGLSTLITPVLSVIPMPVLFGVFLFMGVSSLKGLQFFDRLLLLFIPKKYQPEYAFLKFVPIHKVHLFTMIQLFSLVTLWVIKNNPTTSISFPRGRGDMRLAPSVSLFHDIFLVFDPSGDFLPFLVTSQNVLDSAVSVLNDASTDHRPVLAVVDLAIVAPSPVKLHRRNLKAVKEDLINALSTWPWEALYAVQDVQAATTFVTRGIISALDLVAPLKIIEVRAGRDIYLAPDTLALMRLRDLAAASHVPSDYRVLRNRVSALVRRDRLKANLSKLTTYHQCEI